ncbi:cupin domain-containing protein [Subtercola sp. PAMC28395]|uniref:cupin domain-containing protein n=1 Tax=Subtercola sp. PAMC28395 TaxID=2846775 RepID=UPI00209B26B1|nr:cupin domain-containing protein [Subtercola sp. PAMC28395]
MIDAEPEPAARQLARRTVDGELIEWLDVPDRAAILGLEPHPEGGWYRRTWASGSGVVVAGEPRPAATMIYFLLPPGEASAWHVVAFDEIWLWHGPGAVQLELGGSGEAPLTTDELTLGPAIEQGEHPQLIIPAGVWQRTLPSATEALVTCVVSPGFTFDDWKLAE